uniref:Replication associated protein n=1 Tax=Microviridae sp. ctJKB8 TaxID=2824991 RepID=A0A8S5URY6_9VIRU|nr:MAG TPA: Replication associated protein [Microviridae sp. ctJKB8]
MKYSPELLKAVDHCQHRSFITNRYTGKRIAVDCGQCDYCIYKRAQKASMRVKTAGSAFKHCWFVTLTYDNEHVPLFNCEVYHSEYDDVLSDSGVVYGYEKHSLISVSKYCCTDPQQLRHIYFTQVQGTVPYNRESGQYEPIKDNWFLSMDAIRSFIGKAQSATPYGKDGELSRRYGNNLIPYLNYVDVQNYIKRLRKHLKMALGSYETLHFYAVGEYGPVHFRPHYHILLFTNSKEVSKVLRQCHDKSWKLGRSDFQASRGGAASYVASYVNSLSSAPLLYRSCRAFRPCQRASIGFFEKGEVFEEGEDVYCAIEQKIDSVINGRVYNFNGISVNSTPPMSYIRTLLPRFSSARYDDAVAIARIIRAVANAPKRIARFGIIDYDSDSILSIVRAYYQYLTLNHHLTNEDEIILHNARCLTRLCNSSSDVDIESYLNKLYRLFLYVSKFLRNWHLPPIGGNLDPYANRIMFIIKIGIEYEKKSDYVRMCDSLRIQQTLPAPMLRYFYLPAEGCEMATIGIGEDGEYADGFVRPIKEQIHVPFDDPRIPSLAACNYIKSAKPDTRSSYDSGQGSDLQNCLDFRAATFCRDMIKHKKLNDANDIFNRMV